jgi:acetyltransferase-like isoleucine patch superfamily enzyme
LSVVFPLIAILSKWIIIGRYKAGSYPLWGHYYLRWWLVDQIYYICGRGIFGSNSTLLRMHARLMGAKIGANVLLDSSTKLGEFDLVTIEKGCSFDMARLRPFTMTTGRMVLEPIHVGAFSTINAKTVIAPGHTLKDSTVLPPLSSSYDATQNSSQPEFASYCRTALPEPNFFVKAVLGYPILLFVTLFSYIPWMAVIYKMVSIPYLDNNSALTDLGQIIVYFATDYRIALHMAAMAVKHTISPFFKIFATILVKKLIIGTFKPGSSNNNNGQMTLLKRWIMDKLLGDGTLCGTYALVGRHYGVISWLYRRLGAKIGKRVYWPGTPMRITEFDLLQVGDDVVFGSRSVFIFTSSQESKPIIIESGAMVADRCVLLGGAVIERNCVLGSGGLARHNTVYPAGSVWIGSKSGGAILWSSGTPEAAAADTIKPYGYALYKRKASFFVIPLWLLVSYNVLLGGIAAMLRTSPTVVGVFAGSYYYQFMYNLWLNSPRGTKRQDPLLKVILIFSAGVVVAFFAITTFTMILDIVFKWLLFGRRKQGDYNWDKSSYCQRWQAYLSIISLRIESMQHLRGSYFLVAYFRALGCNIGKRVCLYPTGSDPMMTEPDLVKIGNDVSIDVASIVAHINSRGLFSLNPLVIGDRCVLRAESRVLSGAQLENDSTLLEHTLIVSGDIVDEGSTMQGWPASRV